MQKNTAADSWDLGELIPIDPSLIVGHANHTEVDAFMLALALVFNDLKTTVLLHFDLAERQSPGQLEPKAGQVAGVRIHLIRIAVGIIHELLCLIRENAPILEDAEVKAVVGAMLDKPRSMWLRLVEHANGRGDGSARVLELIRNNVAFHYYQPKSLAAGYREYFFKSSKTPFNDRAYISVGKDMDATRFYFADAAARESMVLLAARKAQTDVDALIQNYVRETNFGLAHIVRAFIAARAPGAGVGDHER